MFQFNLNKSPDYVEKKGNWELRIYYRAKGTKAEGSHGILLFNNKPYITNRVGDEVETDLGLMKYYGEFKEYVKHIWDPSGWNYADRTKIKHSWNLDRLTLKGNLVLNFVGGAHYELECYNGKRYVLFGNLDGIDKLKSSQIEITGYVMKGTVDIYMRGIPFNVITFGELRCYKCPYYRMFRALNEATATRKNGIIEVSMSGILPTVCDEAKIVDIYPGGDIMYFVDPGTAEVFVSIDYKDEFKGYYCIQMEGGLFMLSTKIHDSGHNEVNIFVNNEPYIKIPVQEV